MERFASAKTARERANARLRSQPASPCRSSGTRASPGVTAAFGVASYAFAELWRVYLFNYGIIQFLLPLLIVVPIAHPLVARLWRRLHRPAAPHHR